MQITLLNNRRRSIAAVAGAVAVTAMAVTSASAQDTSNLSNYYIGVDTRPTVTFGTYSGLPNTNLGRLTFLFNHSKIDNPDSAHYHGIGTYSYTGPADNPVPASTNGNNRLPEGYSGQVLELSPGTGAYDGMLVSGIDNGSSGFETYGNMQVRMTDSIPLTDGFGDIGDSGTTPLGYQAFKLFNSSGQGYTSPVGSADITLELVGLTPGLAIGDDAGNMLMDNIGDTVDLFDADGTFTPTFFTADDAAAGVYTASFQLNDNSGTFDSSGTFHIDFTVVPEPASLALLGIGGVALLRRRH